jgi:Glycosyltransferase family 10 (fucosyltransferase) C-term
MKVFVHGFWKGFLEGTDPVSVSVFLRLLSEVFHTEVECGTFEESEILLESIFLSKTYVLDKSWKYSFLFSGESRLVPFYDKYSCVLFGVDSQKNIISCPLYVIYLNSSSHFLKKIENGPSLAHIPKKAVCAIISNANAPVRNKFLQILEKYIPVDYAGRYKTNVPIVSAPYNSDEFITFIKEYKFIISMENSVLDHYITEKITHGMIASTIPVYWGSPKAKEHFNENRFIQLQNDSDNEIHSVIQRMMYLTYNEAEYMNMVNQPIFAENSHKMVRTLSNIAGDVQQLFSIK